MRLHESVKYLVKSFDDDQGLPQSTYIATQCLINELWGMQASKMFSKYIDATEERFYLKPGSADDCLQDMFAVAGLSAPDIEPASSDGEMDHRRASSHQAASLAQIMLLALILTAITMALIHYVIA